MLRKLFTMMALALGVCGALFAPGASAQGAPTCSDFFRVPVIVVDPPPPTPMPTVTPVTDDAMTDNDNVVVGSASVEGPAVATGCADALAYPGPFTNMPITPTSPYAVPRGIAAPATDSATSTPAATSAPGSDLAHSGSEIVVLAYLGTGLLAFGAVALGVRRGGFVE